MLSKLRLSASAGPIAAAALCAIVVLFIWSEYSNWKSQVYSVEASLAQTAEAIAQHADDVLELSRAPLAAMLTEITGGDSAVTRPDKITALIRRQMLASPTLDSLSYIDASGALAASSARNVKAGLDFSERPYFQYHRSRTFALPVLGGPIRSKLSGDWIIPVTQRVSKPDGSFGGIVISTVKVGHFINFFRSFEVGRDGTFLLTRGDGLVLARGPLEDSFLGTSIASHELFSVLLKKQTAGAYHYLSPVDGTRRIGGFYQSRVTGLVVLAGASNEYVFETWVSSAKARWIYATLLLIASALVALYWRKQNRMRRDHAALLAAREAEFRMLAEASSDVIARFDEAGLREYVSPSSLDVLGYPPDVLIGRSIYDGLSPEAEQVVRQAAKRLRQGATKDTVLMRHRKPSGEMIWLETALSKLPTTKTTAATRVVAISRDVTRQKDMQDRLDALSNTDELTGLPNRRAFNAKLEQFVKAAERTGDPLSVLMIDADRFKRYNDTYGHVAGDICLQTLSAAIRGCLNRTADFAARFGGEEIVVLLPGTGPEGACMVAERIRQQLWDLDVPHSENEPFDRVTVSIGVATMQNGEPDAGRLIEKADAALYQAKTMGRNRVMCADAGTHSSRRSLQSR